MRSGAAGRYHSGFTRIGHAGGVAAESMIRLA